MSMIPQPRGRPRDNCTWDMRTGQWLPTAGFNGIAPPAKKPKATRGDRFQIIYAQPRPPRQMNEDLIAKQRALFDASKDRERRQREDEEMYAENLRRNLEEARIYREKEEARQAKLAAEAAAEANRVANLPINVAKRLFPQPLSYPVYYYDDGHMKLLHDNKTPSTTSTIPQQERQAPQVVFDELRDVLWPQLADLSKRRNAIKTRLNKYNTYIKSVPDWCFDRCRRQLISIMLELWQTNRTIQSLGKRQQNILQESWRRGK